MRYLIRTHQHAVRVPRHKERQIASLIEQLDLRIAIDSRFAVGERRGIGKGSLQLLRALTSYSTSYRYEFLVDRPPGSVLPTGNGEWRWIVLRPGFYPIWEQLRLPAYLNKSRPALLHSPGNTAPLIKPRNSRVRQIVTVNDLIFFEPWVPGTPYQKVGRLYRQLVVPSALRRADWVVTLSNSSKAAILDRYPEVRAKISVIGVPVSDELIEYGEGFQGLSLESRNRLVAFGGSDPRKNLGRIVEAFRLVREHFSKAELFVVGCQGGQQQRYRDVQGVRLLPYVPERQLVALYASARALIYPSLSEGFGVPIIEAMAMGLPVITSDRGAMKELADGIGLLVDPESVSSITRAIVDVMVHPDILSARILGGRLKARQFSASQIAKQTVTLYQQVGDC